MIKLEPGQIATTPEAMDRHRRDGIACGYRRGLAVAIKDAMAAVKAGAVSDSISREDILDLVEDWLNESAQ